jgi:hypothetical protein
MIPRLLVAFLAARFASGCSAESTNPTAEPSKVIADTRALRARVSICLGNDVGAAVATFGLEELGGASDATIACLAATSDCKGVLACFGWTRSSCTGDACENSTALHCGNLDNDVRVLTSEDCAQDGEGNHQCAVVDDGKSLTARCNSGVCGGERCEGDVRIHCFGNVEVRENCALKGRICAPTGVGIFCVLPETCERDHCEGNTAVACLGDHVDLRLDCADVVASGRCRDDGCLAETWHPECPAGEPYASFCDGNRALACNVGALYEARCGDFLQGYCEPRERGVGVRCRSSQWP